MRHGNKQLSFDILKDNSVPLSELLTTVQQMNNLKAVLLKKKKKKNLSYKGMIAG